MNNVLRFVSAGVAALGTPWMPRQYPKFSDTPFSDDRRKLHQLLDQPLVWLFTR